MTANISIVTLGVMDLAKSTEFYCALGWKNTTASQESVTFLKGASIILGLYSHNALAEDAATPSARSGFRGVALAINKASEADVDAFFDLAVSKGATAQKSPEKVFWGGYSGYFADHDGHLWEVAYNPFFNFDADTGMLDLETVQ